MLNSEHWSSGDNSPAPLEFSTELLSKSSYTECMAKKQLLLNIKCLQLILLWVPEKKKKKHFLYLLWALLEKSLQESGKKESFLMVIKNSSQFKNSTKRTCLTPTTKALNLYKGLSVKSNVEFMEIFMVFCSINLKGNVWMFIYQLKLLLRQDIWLSSQNYH